MSQAPDPLTQKDPEVLLFGRLGRGRDPFILRAAFSCKFDLARIPKLELLSGGCSKDRCRGKGLTQTSPPGASPPVTPAGRPFTSPCYPRRSLYQYYYTPSKASLRFVLADCTPVAPQSSNWKCRDSIASISDKTIFSSLRRSRHLRLPNIIIFRRHYCSRGPAS